MLSRNSSRWVAIFLDDVAVGMDRSGSGIGRCLDSRDLGNPLLEEPLDSLLEGM